jgi:predicted tellurium resistance membrane protein TerC
MDMLLSMEMWAAFFTLTALEIVLGIDNIIFISVLTGRLPVEQQARARFIGLALAMVLRIVLLLSLAFIMGLTSDLFAVAGNGISGRDIILLVGGAFLMWTAVREVHNALEGVHDGHHEARVVTFNSVLLQIALVDIVFSLDSVITAVGLVDHVGIMIAAIVIAVLVMMMAAGTISRFVEEHPTLKMLALSFLILIGLTLFGEGLDFHTPKGYIYFAMAFAFIVEVLNLRIARRRAQKRQDKVKLRVAQLGDLIH